MSLPHRLAAAVLFGCMLAGSLAVARPAQALDTFDQVKKSYTPSDAWLLDRHGRELQQLRLDRQVRRLAWTPIEDVSPSLLRALLYSEDKRFYEHAGVDWNAAAASAWRNLWNTKTRGASTLTMQLTGLLENGAVGRPRDAACWKRPGRPSMRSGWSATGARTRFWRATSISLVSGASCRASRP